jgi:hypothetical protein
MRHYSSRGLSLPTGMLERIDASRGDVSRSRFLLRLLERIYSAEKEGKKEEFLSE